MPFIPKNAQKASHVSKWVSHVRLRAVWRANVPNEPSMFSKGPPVVRLKGGCSIWGRLIDFSRALVRYVTQSMQRVDVVPNRMLRRHCSFCYTIVDVHHRSNVTPSLFVYTLRCGQTSNEAAKLSEFALLHDWERKCKAAALRAFLGILGNHGLGHGNRNDMHQSGTIDSVEARMDIGCSQNALHPRSSITAEFDGTDLLTGVHCNHSIPV